MKSIIVCRDSADRLLTRTIAEACASCGGVLVIDGGTATASSPEPEFTVICMDRPEKISCSAVLVFGNTPCRTDRLPELDGVTAVIDSGNASALRLLGASSVPVVGCSASERDTLTLSCRSEDHAVLSLQRAVMTLSGRIVEPCEIRLRCAADTPLYPVLASCAALLLYDAVAG